MSAYRTRITVAVAMVAIPTMTPTVCLELKPSDDVSVVPPIVWKAAESISYIILVCSIYLLDPPSSPLLFAEE